MVAGKLAQSGKGAGDSAGHRHGWIMVMLVRCCWAPAPRSLWR